MGAPVISLLAVVAAVFSAASACPYAGSEPAPVDVHHRALSTTSPCRKNTDLPTGLKANYGDIAGAQTCFQAALGIMSSNWDKKYAGPILRMAFHDCGTYNANKNDIVFGSIETQCGGCNGSFKKEFEYGRDNGFDKYFPQQNGMQLAYDFFWGSIGVAKKITDTPACANMSKADIISLSGYVALHKSGGSPDGCAWYPGRTDMGGFDDTTKLPPASGTAEQLKINFDAYDFQKALDHFPSNPTTFLGIENMYEAVALYSSAHTIGMDRVTSKSPDSQGPGAMDSTPDYFDGIYFQQVVTAGGYKGMAGWFASDRHGKCDKLTGLDTDLLAKRVCTENTPSAMYPYYSKYAKNYMAGNDAPFRSNFCKALQAMSTIGYDFPIDYDDVVKKYKFIV